MSGSVLWQRFSKAIPADLLSSARTNAQVEPEYSHLRESALRSHVGDFSVSSKDAGLTRCANPDCGKLEQRKGATHKKCGGCGLVKYCSPQCQASLKLYSCCPVFSFGVGLQRAHWKKHRPECAQKRETYAVLAAQHARPEGQPG